MMRKKISLFFISVCFSGLFVSCWDNYTERAFYSANVTSFVFEAHDTCPDIEKYVFNIDNSSDTGLIFNLDSLPYGSVVNNLYPTLELQSSNGDIFMNDSLWSDGDSLDFTKPVVLKNTSADGLFKRVYKIKVNVHQVNPDSMQLKMVSTHYPADASKNKMITVNGNFRSYFELPSGGISAYISSDKGLSWTSEPVSGISEIMNIASLCRFKENFFVTSKTGQLYSSTDGLSWNVAGDGTKIVTLYGQLKKNYRNGTDTNSYLIGLAINASGDTCFARSSDGIDWKELGSVIDSRFPVSEYGLTKGSNAYNGFEFYTIATGLNSSGKLASKVWSTDTGLDWVIVSNAYDSTMALDQRKGASLFYYDNCLVCFGGIDTSGIYRKDIYVSKDNGIRWIDAPDDWAFVKMAGGLAYSQVYVEHQADAVNDKDREFIWIFGGKKTSSVSTDIWNGYLNKMIFARR